jgi:hypothetical protein
VVRCSLANCGGCTNIYLIKSREELDKLRADNYYAWRPRAIITIGFRPDVVWDGPVTFETSKFLWDEPQSNFEYCEKVNGYFNPLEYDRLLEDKGKDVIVIREIKWWESDSHCGHVPLSDGTIKPGAY